MWSLAYSPVCRACRCASHSETGHLFQFFGIAGTFHIDLRSGGIDVVEIVGRCDGQKNPGSLSFQGSSLHSAIALVANKYYARIVTTKAWVGDTAVRCFDCNRYAAKRLGLQFTGVCGLVCGGGRGLRRSCGRIRRRCRLVRRYGPPQ
jgi:hypothetical protein